MERAAPSRRWGMKSRRSRSFSGLSGGYPGMSEGARARLGEVEDEEGEESVEEEDSGETEVADAPEVPQGSNLAPTNQTLVSQSDPSLLKIMRKWLLLWHSFLKQQPQGQFQSPCIQDSINEGT
ncbi:hypothetical protein O181_041631 [Austropuccinia psidii MF-1]|uniref:Uncharacterized protein n=1 Tax=Austropuccinia psidii MF-1 TaxID=1389203 RepID=A0A9Q3DDD9_9BASI|nr:hypothetical protein [Austropuccinia psidii MF-1]